MKALDMKNQKRVPSIPQMNMKGRSKVMFQ